MVRALILFTLAVSALSLKAQTIDAFATARVNTKKVVIEQAVKVSVKAYSSTWFAEPLTFKNLQVDGAYVQSFKRTISSIEYINRKKYAALEFHYILFPYASGEIIFPELELTTSIPPENDYKGQDVTLRTQSIRIIVEPAPAEADPTRWLVASNARISNEWSLDLKELKVGDVLRRKITINASGTLPTFIDEPLMEPVDFASIYTSEPQFIDTRDNKSANGRRIDTYSYLLEKPGEFTLPETEVSWWNPHLRQFYKRKLPAYTLHIKPNENMSQLEALKDSLQALRPSINNLANEDADEAELATLLNYTLAFIGISVLLYVLILITIRIRRIIKKKHELYLLSENYWFNNIFKYKNRQQLVSGIYQWTNHLPLAPDDKTFKAISKEAPDLGKELTRLNQSVYSNQGEKSKLKLNRIKQLLKKRRKGLIEKKDPTQNNSLGDINP